MVEGGWLMGGAQYGILVFPIREGGGNYGEALVKNQPKIYTYPPPPKCKIQTSLRKQFLLEDVGKNYFEDKDLKNVRNKMSHLLGK